MKVELDLSHYATQVDLKNAAGVNISDFAGKTDLANLRSNVDKLGIDKLKNVSSNLNKNEKVENDVVKKDVYNAKIKNIEDKIPDITNLAANASVNAKIYEVKGGIPSVTNLATNASRNAKINEVKGETPSITN